MLQRLLGDAIEVRTELADALRAGYFDPHQLETALLNLAINARDAMPGAASSHHHRGCRAAGRPPRRRRRGRRRAAVLRPDHRRRHRHRHGRDGAAPRRRAVFTTKEVGRGSGLGLSMVYGFVTQSGGQIDITSAPGRGSVVRLYLPAVSTAPRQAEASLHPADAAGRREPHEPALAAADEPDLRVVAAPLPAGSGGGERL